MLVTMQAVMCAFKEKEPEEYEVERVVDYQFCKLEVSFLVCGRHIVADPDL